MVSPVLASDEVNRYSLAVTLESSRHSPLIESLGGSDGEVLLTKFPVTAQHTYALKASNFGEKFVTRGCDSADGKLMVKPGQKAMVADLEISGDWATAKSDSKGEYLVLDSTFSMDIKDVDRMHVIGKLNNDCSIETAIERGLYVTGTFRLSPDSGRDASYTLGNGYSLQFELMEH